MRRTLPNEVAPDGFNMTPMIDIVFQLIIFFMLVTDMADRQIEPLKLPSASQAAVVKDEPQSLLLNVRDDGTVLHNGRVLWSPRKADDCAALENLFLSRRAIRYNQYPLVVRCDRSASFEHMQKLLMIASSPEYGDVSRVRLVADKEDK